MNIKLLIIGIVLSTTIGCSSFQPSTYTNYNTPYGNVIQATGRSADNAGLVNTSYNCPSCTISGRTQNRSNGIRNYRTEQDYMSGITDSAIRTLSSTISNNINTEIRGLNK